MRLKTDVRCTLRFHRTAINDQKIAEIRGVIIRSKKINERTRYDDVIIILFHGT